MPTVRQSIVPRAGDSNNQVPQLPAENTVFYGGKTFSESEVASSQILIITSLRPLQALMPVWGTTSPFTTPFPVACHAYLRSMLCVRRSGSRPWLLVSLTLPPAARVQQLQPPLLPRHLKV